MVIEQTGLLYHSTLYINFQLIPPLYEYIRY